MWAHFLRFVCGISAASALILSVQASGDELPALALPLSSRGLTQTEIDTVAEIVVNDVSPVDGQSGQELLSKLQRGQIRAVKRGFGFTNPINGRIALSYCFFSSERAFLLLKNQIKDSKQRGDGVRSIHPLDPSFKIMAPESSLSDLAYRIFIAGLLVHENIHLRQGRRYLKVGAILAMASTRISSIFTGFDPQEIEAYDYQAQFLSDYRDMITSSRYLSRENKQKLYRWIDQQIGWNRSMITDDSAGSTYVSALAFKPKCDR